MNKLKVGDIVKKKRVYVYGIVITEEKTVGIWSTGMVGIVSEISDHLTHIAEDWHKVCRYSDLAAEVYRIPAETVDFFKRSTMWRRNNGIK